jgi:hypothetical protein
MARQNRILEGQKGTHRETTVGQEIVGLIFERGTESTKRVGLSGVAAVSQTNIPRYAQCPCVVWFDTKAELYEALDN